jgi:ABC-type ATPase with predicted acetyltransferase domain
MSHRWNCALTEDHGYSADRESLLVWLCDDCANHLEAELQLTDSNGVDEYIACDVACCQCDKPIETMERIQR